MKRTRTAFRVLRAEGPRGLAAAVAKRLASPDGSTPVHLMLVAHDDVLAVDWSQPHPSAASPIVVKDRPLRLAWITSPPGKESGGHQNIWRFIAQAEKAGHRCSVHLYDANGTAPSLRQTQQMLAHSKSFTPVAAPISVWDPAVGVGKDADAVIATGWETAYASYRDPSLARRLYFVQDFEPSFYPVGSQAVLAENTYRFGFHGITAGRWLSTMLAERYGMTAAAFDFAADTHQYHVSNSGERNGVFFYARPVTPRRAYELGAFALEAFHRMRPQATIHLAGWKIDSSQLPFKHVSHSSLPLASLNDLYNECAAGLVLSLTNMSLLPLELLASGVSTVVNDAPNNRMVSDNPQLRWTLPNPTAIASALAEAYDRNNDSSEAQANHDSLGTWTWDDSGRQFVEAVEAHLGRR